LSVFEVSVILLFPLILSLSGGFLMLTLQKIPREEEFFESEQQFSNVILYSLVGLALIFAIAFSVNLFKPKPQSIFQVLATFPPIYQKLFSISMAISEEVFFRGFLLNWLSQLNFVFANVGQALVFTVYHFAVYGQEPFILLYVFASGIVLGFISWKTQSLTPAMLAHMAVNALA
jgi:membrane protease YdiL (CAAX protease family)